MRDCHSKEILMWHNPPDTGSDDCALSGMAYYADEVKRQVNKPEDLDFAYHGFPDFRKYAEAFLRKASTIMGRPFSGIGIDIGSGCGVGAALLSKLPTVNKIYALDISKDFIEKIMPLTFDRVQADCAKIIKVVGDFNDIKLEDNSIDFAIEIGAFHHSSDLKATIQESYRVLKPEGWLVLLERSRPDNCSREEIDYLLNIEFTDEFKQRYGIPLSQKFTRGDWGENEYRLCDWVSILSNNGFKVFIYRTFGMRLNNMISYLCKFISKYIHNPAVNKIIHKIQFHYWLQMIGKRILLVCQKSH